VARALENPDSKPTYLEYFGMTRPPFDQLPGPSPIFLSDQYSLLTAHLTSATEQSDCLMSICGADGSGKTTLLNRYITSLSDDVSFAAFDDTCKDGTEFYIGFLRQLGFRDITGSLRELRRITKEFLIHRGNAGDPVLVIIDNAHLICASVYEQLRWIAETKVDDRRVMSVVLAGNKDLQRIMDSPAMQSIKFRSHIDFNIRVYTEEETEDYVRHRLRLAGGIDAAKFANEARPLIYEFSGGVPSSINRLCNEVLSEAYTRETRIISANLVRIVADSHHIEPPTPVPAPKGRRKTDPDYGLPVPGQPEARITARDVPQQTATGKPDRDSGFPDVDVPALLAQVGELSEKLAETESTRNQAVLDICVRDKDVDKLNKQLAALLKKTAKQESTAEENADKIRKLKTELSDAAKALSISEKAAESATRDSKMPKARIGALQVQIDQLSDKLVSLEVVEKQAQQEILARDKDVQNLQKQLDAQTKRTEKQQRTAEEKADQVRRLKQELSDTAKALRAHEKLAKKATPESGKSNAKVAALLLQIDQLGDQLASLEATEQEAQQGIRARDKEIAELQKLLDTQAKDAEKQESEGERHADEIRQLKETLAESTAALRNNEKDAGTLAADLKKEERATSRANAEVTKLKTKTEKLEETKSELQASVSALTSDLKETNKRVNKSHVVEKNNEALKKKIETKTAQLSDRDKVLTELEKTLRESQKECDSLRSSAEGQNSFDASAEEKDARIADLETELAAANTRLSMHDEATERPAGAINALEVVKDKKVVQVFPIDSDQARIMIGRSEDSELCLDSKFVSRHHALIFVTDHRVYVEDLNSFNGVIVNSKTITRLELRADDTVLIGDFIIRPRRS